MHQSDDQDQDQQSDNWPLTEFEDECIRELQSEPNLGDRLTFEKEKGEQVVFMNFQNSAAAISQLYKDRHEVAWLPFQNAALSVTNMYRECLNRMQQSVDLGQQSGRYIRTKELIAWARKRRRNIRRDDLLAFLCGKPAPAKARMHVKPRPLSLDRSLPHCLGHAMTADDRVEEHEDNLGPFHHALAVHGLHGAMSNISVGYSDHDPPFEDDLSHYIREEARRNKRSASSQDLHDSPGRKRSRLL